MSDGGTRGTSKCQKVIKFIERDSNRKLSTLEKDINIQREESQRPLVRFLSAKPTPRHVIIRIFKTVTEKKQTALQGAPVGFSISCSAEIFHIREE